jgi:hypothetical protein
MALLVSFRIAGITGVSYYIQVDLLVSLLENKFCLPG